jgi:hypothetical protein
VSNVTSRRAVRIGALLLLCALIGVAVFSVLAWQAVTVEEATRAEADRRIASVRAGLPSKVPLVEIDDDGRVVRAPPPSEVAGRPVARLKALAWRAADRRLVSIDSPFWFVKLKGPAAAYALEDTGLDLDRLGLTPAALERIGPAVIVDHTRRDGSRVLVWTE